MSFTPSNVIEVSAWGRVVGAVALDPTMNFYAFEYDDDWIDTGVDLAPLHLPRRRGTFVFPELNRQTFYGLPGMLADALPDKFGNALVNAWMADQGVSASQITALDRLAYASDRAMGALTFAPPTGPPTSEVSVVQLADLVTAARAQIAGSLDDSEDIHRALAELITVGSTAGGARAKAVVAYNPTTGQIRSGQFNAPAGYEQWLLKLDGVGDTVGQNDPLGTSQQYCRVEYAYYLMATSAGIEMSESRLLHEDSRAHFMTRRFDRGVENERIHSQTLCALAHLDYNASHAHSYASYFLTARELGLGPDDLQQIFRRVVFNVMASNRDDHAKNFSFLLKERGAWQLAPAYDVTHSNWGVEWTNGHQMSVRGRFLGITLDDLRALGDQQGVPGIEQVLRDVAEATNEWRAFAFEAGVDGSEVEKIASDIIDFRPR
ncbi:MAG TPA: type II toxin-antitoxin system HipA family toxin [Acidimicrobiales bacterium]|nr:type II toxin-antitoxin system HipA family toxin [Acidimicrobiales bacterium]